MTLELVILNNPGMKVVEMYDGKEYTLEKGDNILLKHIARAFCSKTARNYKITGKAEQDFICPLCKQVVKVLSPQKPALVQEPYQEIKKEEKKKKPAEESEKKEENMPSL